jgi:hypothetical protein
MVFSLPQPRRALFALAVLIVATLAFACSGGTEVVPEPDPEPEPGANPGVVHTPPPDATTVSVDLLEFQVVPEVASAPAGQVYFLADNIGGEPHELVVIRSDVAPDALPVVDGRVPEDDVDIVGEIEPFDAGTQASAAFDLTPGNYILICNIAEQEDGELESHYQEGMRVAFTVE